MRILLLIAAGAFVSGVASPASGLAARERTVPLPTELDALAFTPFAQTLLFADRGIETSLPGPVIDRERVDVGLHTDGSVSRVRVSQRLIVSGLGDYTFRVPGPASDVDALPGSATNPGLRKGSVLWQGFSSGREVLAAEVDLMPHLERDRLPLAFDLGMTVGGTPLEPGKTASGAFTFTLRISNSSEAPIGVVTAPADPGALAPTLDAVRGVLRRGARPVPGTGGVPKAVPVQGRPRRETTDVRVPFVIRGRISFPPGTLTEVRVAGGTAKTDGRGTVVMFRRALGGGAPNALELSVTGVARNLGLPELTLRAEPSLPSARALDPPTGQTWRESVRVQPSALDGREMLSLLMQTMWEVARIRQFEAYLGNPDLRGDSQSTYLFRLSPRVPAPPPAEPPEPRRPGPLGVAGVAVGALVVLTGLGLVWARS